MDERIYLDNNATTPIDPDALKSFVETANLLGNPSSSHREGKALRSILMNARDRIANFLQVKSKEIIFTSGATEAINYFINGLFEGGHKKGHIITSNVEHSAVYACVKHLESLGVEVTYLSAGEYGAIRPGEVQEAIQPNTRLIALMAVNNETGVKTDFHGVAQVAELYGIPYFVDAVALFGKELFTIPSGVTAMATSGHKLHAPKGVGFLYIRRGTKVPPLLYGGSHEYGHRAGTENIAGIAAYGTAVTKVSEELPHLTQKLQELRDRLEQGLLKHIPDAVVNGTGPRICNTTNIAFPGVQGETFLAMLDMEGVAVSHGSACASGALEPSRVLTNMGISKDLINASIRFSVGRTTTEDEIDRAIAIVSGVVNRLRVSVTT